MWVTGLLHQNARQSIILLIVRGDGISLVRAGNSRNPRILNPMCPQYLYKMLYTKYSTGKIRPWN